LAEMEDRHHLMFETYEEGKLTLGEYLDRVVFYNKRPFTWAPFRRFMFAQSKPHPEMITLVARLKVRHGLEVVVVSNEARELNAYGIRTANPTNLADFFISSYFVRVRNPDADIFRLALDVAQITPERVVHIDDLAMFVEVADRLGIHGIHHRGLETTCAALAALGLK
jgi:putative hydrolase of the HAD superfamily